MGIKEITKRIKRILGQDEAARARKAAKLAGLLEKLEKKRKKLELKVPGATSPKELRKIVKRLRMTEVHLAKGREELERLESEGL